MLGSNHFLGLSLVFLTCYYFGWKSTKSEVFTPTIKLPDGKIRGLVSSSNEGKLMYKYLGIPYAQPPIGDLRFEPPEPVKPWQKTKDTIEFGSKCLQIAFLTETVNGKEDCLFLNVFTPVRQKGNLKNNKGLPEQKLPVMVFFHGGAFIRGSADIYGPDYFFRQDMEDVVFVTFNYRLSSFGFLNTGDGKIRGNMALMDQNLALKWIQNNIYLFGGDKNKVTIFGESAGAASVHYQMLSPQSKGLFSRAISQSGTALNHWAQNPNPKEQALYFSRELGCPTEDSDMMVECLKSLDALKIVEFNSRIRAPVDDMLALFRPTIEVLQDSKSFLTQKPEVIIKSGNFSKVPWINGLNSEEGLLFAIPIMRKDELLTLVDENWQEIMPKYLDMTNSPSDIFEKLRQFYFGDEKRINWNVQWKNLTDLFSDRSWYIDIRKASILHSEHHQVYTYYYSYAGETSLANLLMAIKNKYFSPLNDLRLNAVITWVNKKILGHDAPFYGVSHADDLITMFKTPFGREIEKGSKDYEFSKDFVELWISFAKNEELIFREVLWNPIEPHEKPLKYLNIDEFGFQIKEPFQNRMKFWEEIQSDSKLQ